MGLPKYISTSFAVKSFFSFSFFCRPALLDKLKLFLARFHDRLAHFVGTHVALEISRVPKLSE